MENLYSFIVVKNFNEYLNAFKKGYFPEYIIWNNPNSTKEIEDYLFRSNRNMMMTIIFYMPSIIL